MRRWLATALSVLLISSSLLGTPKGTSSTTSNSTSKSASEKSTTTKSTNSKSRTTSTSSKKSTSTSKKTSTPKKSNVAARDSNGKIKRSAAAVKSFEKETGYPHGRKGYIVDHVIPLECGGADTPSNMQWQTVQEAKIKDRTEMNCRR